MNKYKLLSIDESGKASYGHPSKYFILCGVIIEESRRNKIYRSLSKIKDKYFGDSEIILHGRDIFRKAGPFASLKDPVAETNFWSELINVINDEKICFVTIIVNKEHAQKRNWELNTILNRSYRSLLRKFKLNLSKTKLYGRIIAESDTNQDIFLLRAHHYHQSNSPTYREHITSLSYVTKGNRDPDVELADSMALISRFYYENKGSSAKLTPIQRVKIKFIRRKIASKINPSYLFRLKIR